MMRAVRAKVAYLCDRVAIVIVGVEMSASISSPADCSLFSVFFS
jgi:hypothetical protein